MKRVNRPIRDNRCVSLRFWWYANEEPEKRWTVKAVHDLSEREGWGHGESVKSAVTDAICNLILALFDEEPAYAADLFGGAKE